MKPFALYILFVFVFFRFSVAKDIKVAVINMNLIINGIISEKDKKFLENLKKNLIETKNSLKNLELSIQNNEEEITQIRDNSILNEEKKKKKIEKLFLTRRKILADLSRFQQQYLKQERDYQKTERPYTEKLFLEGKKCASIFKNDFDFIIEASIAAGFLYSKQPFTDITGELINKYKNKQCPSQKTVKK